jgi:transposase
MSNKTASPNTAPFDLTDEQWQIISPLLPNIPQAKTGRPPVPDRQILNGILWKLRTGIPWHLLPKTYPSYQTCRRRYNQWSQRGILEQILRALAKDLQQRAGLDIFSYFNPLTLRVHNRSGLFSLLYQADMQNPWQLATLLLFLFPRAEEKERNY